MRLGKPFAGLLAGTLLGLSIVMVLVALDVEIGKKSSDPLAIVTTPQAATGFVDAWQRMRSGTWAVDSDYLRRTPDGRTLSGSVHEARRPPDHIRIALGSVDATLRGRRLVCGSSPAGEQACRDGGPAPDDAAEAAQELQTLRSNVLGTTPTYDVADQGGGCFALYPRPSPLDAQWGPGSRFCFDPQSGAPTLTDIRRSGGSDVITALSVRRQPTDADLQPPTP